MSKNSRQIPNKREFISDKDYCDLLYAWLQCNSERLGPNEQGRYVPKSEVVFSRIEKDFTDSEGNKVMNRKTISKYFNWLLEQELVIYNEKERRYELKVLEANCASLIEYKTLSTLMNVLKRHSISIYVYLYNRYYANKGEYVITIKQIKDMIGIATSTTSNNIIVSDTLNILKRLQLLDYAIVYENEKTIIHVKWVKNELP